MGKDTLIMRLFLLTIEINPFSSSGNVKLKVTVKSQILHLVTY